MRGPRDGPAAVRPVVDVVAGDLQAVEEHVPRPRLREFRHLPARAEGCRRRLRSRPEEDLSEGVHAPVDVAAPYGQVLQDAPHALLAAERRGVHRRVLRHLDRVGADDARAAEDVVRDQPQRQVQRPLRRLVGLHRPVRVFAEQVGPPESVRRRLARPAEAADEDLAQLVDHPAQPHPHAGRVFDFPVFNTPEVQPLFDAALLRGDAEKVAGREVRVLLEPAVQPQLRRAAAALAVQLKPTAADAPRVQPLAGRCRVDAVIAEDTHRGPSVCWGTHRERVAPAKAGPAT